MRVRVRTSDAGRGGADDNNDVHIRRPKEPEDGGDNELSDNRVVERLAIVQWVKWREEEGVVQTSCRQSEEDGGEEPLKIVREISTAHLL